MPRTLRVSKTRKAFDKRRAAVYAKLVEDRRWQRLEAAKDRAFRNDKNAELDYYRAKTEANLERWNRAKRSTTRVLRAMQRFEDGYLRLHDVYVYKPTDEDVYGRDRPLRRRRA